MYRIKAGKCPGALFLAKTSIIRVVNAPLFNKNAKKRHVHTVNAPPFLFFGGERPGTELASSLREENEAVSEVGKGVLYMKMLTYGYNS